jgi:CubicO group peptidase (beta-lactamase class C family)
MAMPRPAETMPRDQLHGWVAPGFEPVQQTFADNFAQRGELGAACAVYRHGEPVVDLWGGLRDRGLPWRQDTLVLVFSLTKGMTATALAVAHARGLLDYDTPVTASWPAFAQAGKQAITIRQVLAHQAGLATIDQRLRLVDLADQDRLAALIARQRPQWAPGTRQGYHYLTSGWIAAELIARTDHAGRTLGRFFAEEVAAPLGLDFHIGLPPEVPDERVDRPELRRIQIPAAGGIGTARAVARCCEELATGRPRRPRATRRPRPAQVPMAYKAVATGYPPFDRHPGPGQDLCARPNRMSPY